MHDKIFDWLSIHYESSYMVFPMRLEQNDFGISRIRRNGKKPDQIWILLKEWKMGSDAILKCVCTRVCQILFLPAAKISWNVIQIWFKTGYSKLTLLNLHNTNGYILQYYWQESKITKTRWIALFREVVDFLPGISTGAHSRYQKRTNDNFTFSFLSISLKLSAQFSSSISGWVLETQVW